MLMPVGLEIGAPVAATEYFEVVFGVGNSPPRPGMEMGSTPASANAGNSASETSMLFGRYCDDSSRLVWISG